MKRSSLLCIILAGVSLIACNAVAITVVQTLSTTVTASSAITTFTFNSGPVLFPAISPFYTGGSAAFTLTDLNGDGATFSAPAGSQLVDFWINGSSFQKFGSDPYNFSVGPNASATVTFDFGTPIPSLPGSSASSIQAFAGFVLSPLDKVSMNTLLKVSSEPAPTNGVPDGGSSLAMLGFAVVGCTALRKRFAR